MATKQPGLLEQLVDDAHRSHTTPAVDLPEFLKMVSVPVADGKPDTQAFINLILEKGKEYAALHGMDPLQTTPGYTDLKNILETKGVIEGGKLTQAGINQIAGLYTGQAGNYTVSRAQNGILRMAPGGSTQDAVSVAAATGHYDLIEDIKASKTPEDVARYLGPALNDFLDKVRGAAGRGKLKQYVDTLKGYIGKLVPAPTSQPAYAH